jgi:tetratricopeptide (TPR) repeat protein
MPPARYLVWSAIVAAVLIEVVALVYLESSAVRPATLTPQEIARSRLVTARLSVNPDEYFKEAEAYLKEYPADWGTRLELAGEYGKRGKHAAALPHYQAALKDRPRDVNILLGAARACGLLNQHDLAVSYFEEASRVDPKNARVFRELGMALHRKGDTTRAIDALQKSLTLDPNQRDLTSLINRIAQGKTAGAVPPGAPPRPPGFPGAPTPAGMPGTRPPTPGPPPPPRPVDPSRYGLDRGAPGP